ncbi:MAG: PASTA domain-containing protein [Gemmatimonadaceae bacterium]
MNWRTAVRSALLHIVVGAGAIRLAYLAVTFFVFPAGGVIPDDVTVPNVIGLQVADAERLLTQKGFKPERGETRSEGVAPKNTVVEQTPPAGGKELVGTTVRLVVSGGQRTGTVPIVTGLTQDQAEEALAAAGFDVGDVTERASNEARGTVIESRPRGGGPAPMPGSVALVISAGPGTVQVPDLTGRTVQEARQLLQQLGLEVGELSSESSAGPPIIVSQTPLAGNAVAPGTRVNIRTSGVAF